MPTPRKRTGSTRRRVRFARCGCRMVRASERSPGGVTQPRTTAWGSRIGQRALAAIGDPCGADLQGRDTIVRREVDRPDHSAHPHVLGALIDPNPLLALDEQIAIGQYPDDGGGDVAGQTVALRAVACTVELGCIVDV